jgi:hypothetical protein
MAVTGDLLTIFMPSSTHFLENPCMTAKGSAWESIGL